MQNGPVHPMIDVTPDKQRYKTFGHRRLNEPCALSIVRFLHRCKI
jgi:hypothetical protein